MGDKYLQLVMVNLKANQPQIQQGIASLSLTRTGHRIDIEKLEGSMNMNKSSSSLFMFLYLKYILETVCDETQNLNNTDSETFFANKICNLS